MSFFSSDRERRLFFGLVAVLVGIYATLGKAPALAAVLRERNDLTGVLFFVLFVAIMVVAVLFIKKRPGRAEIAVGVGILVTYLMAWLRIGALEERTHLFEYSLVAALVHEVLVERQENGRHVPAVPMLALVISVLLGWLDEGIQAILPNRVYDFRDVVFNSVAAVIVIGARWVLARVRRWAHRGRMDRLI